MFTSTHTEEKVSLLQRHHLQSTGKTKLGITIKLVAVDYANSEVTDHACWLGWHKWWLKKSLKCANKNNILGFQSKCSWKKVWNIFLCSMARSTWMRTLEIRRVSTSSAWSSCSCPPNNGGMLMCVPSGKSSAMSNLQSTMTESPASRRERSPDRLVNSLSEMRPPYKDERNVITPLGFTPTSSFNIFLFL